MGWIPPPPEPPLLPPDRPTADPGTWLRSLPLRWGVAIIVAAVLLGCLVPTLLLQAWPLVVLAAGCGVTTIPLAYHWLEPWHGIIAIRWTTGTKTNQGMVVTIGADGRCASDGTNCRAGRPGLRFLNWRLIRILR